MKKKSVPLWTQIESPGLKPRCVLKNFFFFFTRRIPSKPCLHELHVVLIYPDSLTVSHSLTERGLSSEEGVLSWRDVERGQNGKREQGKDRPDILREKKKVKSKAANVHAPPR